MKLLALLLLIPSFSMAGLKFPSDRLKVMDTETLRRIVATNLNGAQTAINRGGSAESEGQFMDTGTNEYTREEGAKLIQESLELIFARPEQNYATSVVYSNVEGVAIEYGGIYQFIEEITKQGLSTLDKSGKDKTLLRDQNTYIYILNNMMAEIKPLVLSEEGEKYKKLVEKIRDEDINFSDALKSYRMLNSMSNITNPSKVAAQEAQKKEIEMAAKAEDEARENEFKNPKLPDTAGKRAVLGSAAAPITIVEYSDFQCPFCQRGSDTVNRVLKEYEGKVKLLFKHLPLESKHPNARRGSEYFEAIAMQDAKKAYDFKQLIFQNQNETYGDAEKLYAKLAKKVGADMSKLKTDLKAKLDKITQIINKDMKEASKFGFNGTPGYLINGVSLKGAYPFEEFKKVIDRHLGIKDEGKESKEGKEG